ncbi:hypothetical protein [Flagellimonas baculiformis]|uniref:hypothetical protein n=1 Tax=Flagellimonas baculiformis TaxID=3067310 RepID=UPI00296E7CFE|nr:hypothetical protein [Muricauda sp. D6]
MNPPSFLRIIVFVLIISWLFDYVSFGMPLGIAFAQRGLVKYRWIPDPVGSMTIDSSKEKWNRSGKNTSGAYVPPVGFCPFVN